MAISLFSSNPLLDLLLCLLLFVVCVEHLVDFYLIYLCFIFILELIRNYFNKVLRYAFIVVEIPCCGPYVSA